MSDLADEPRKQPYDPDLDFADGEAADDDFEVIAGMRRLGELRAGEAGVSEVAP